MKKRIDAFGHALRGGRTLVLSQPHARFHSLATCLVLFLGFLFRITALEWALLAIAITIVWVAEALNTALEFLADEVSKDWRDGIKRSKDIAAFSVLVAALGAFLVGLLVFAPYFSIKA